MAKHYIRIDEENKVIYGYSDDFETPIDTDICINENGGRQFELLGEVNPSLLDENECHRFRCDQTTVEHYKEVVEDATDEIKVSVDTSGVELDDPDAEMEGIDVNNNITATVRGRKLISTEIVYTVRYSTKEELEEEKDERPDPEPVPSQEEQIAELQEKIIILEEQNEMLTDCLLEMSEIVYGL